MHLFEFSDLPIVPKSIRQTLFELMELCNRGFRSFNRRAASEALTRAKQTNCQTIVELGAGRAPLTKLLSEEAREAGIRLVPCDLVPDVDLYEALERNNPNVVRPVYTPVDYSKEHDFGSNTLAVLVGTFHHIPPAARQKTLRALAKSASHIMVFEPLRNTPLSISLVFLSVAPALLLPLSNLGSEGTWRRILWCWLVPVVPFVFVWDGVVSCLRQWSPARWKQALREAAGDDRPPTVLAGVHSLVASC
jgi:hypothetical protein